MIKIKTSELIGPALDYAVALSSGKVSKYYCTRYGNAENVRSWKPSTNWLQGGPILTREKISILAGRLNYWATSAVNGCGLTAVGEVGATPLIAAMRCYVQSKLGDTVDVPSEVAK